MTAETDRAGELERFAVDHALRAAWTTEFWVPQEREYGFVDYVEAAAARNLGLLRGFETLAEDVDRRGILPSVDGEQATLVTDGGQSSSDTDRIECVECGKDLTDPKNCGDPDVGGDWVCADDNCRIMHEPEMAVNRRVLRP